MVRKMPLKCLRRWKLGNLCPKCVLVVKSSFEDMKNSSSLYKIKVWGGLRPFLDKNLYYALRSFTFCSFKSDEKKSLKIIAILSTFLSVSRSILALFSLFLP